MLGIDPGLSLTGYGCLELEPAHAGSARVVEAGCFRFKSRQTVSSRLVELERDLAELIQRVAPEFACVETVFAHSAHPRTAITMAHARGVVLLVVKRSGLDLLEVSPAAVKRALTGNGRAGKAQMQRAIAAVLGLAAAPSPPDVADALAVAMCGARRRSANPEIEAAVARPRSRARR